MTNAERILDTVASIIRSDPHVIFSLDEVCHQVGISRADWDASASPIYQAMREDQPGGGYSSDCVDATRMSCAKLSVARIR